MRRSAQTRAIRGFLANRLICSGEAGLARPGNRPGALDLDPVGVDLDPEVVAGQTVGAVDHGVDDAFQPGIARDDRLRLETDLSRPGPVVAGSAR